MVGFPANSKIFWCLVCLMFPGWYGLLSEEDGLGDSPVEGDIVRQTPAQHTRQLDCTSFCSATALVVAFGIEEVSKCDGLNVVRSINHQIRLCDACDSHSFTFGVPQLQNDSDALLLRWCFLIMFVVMQSSVRSSKRLIWISVSNYLQLTLQQGAYRDILIALCL